MSDDLQFLTVNETAELLGLAPRTLDRYRVSGHGPTYYKFGNRVRYRLSEVMAWAETKQMKSTKRKASSRDE